MTPEERLAELGHELPAPNPRRRELRRRGHGRQDRLRLRPRPVPGRRATSSRASSAARSTSPTGQQAAELTIVNLLASLKAEIGELDRVQRVVKLLVLVNSDPEFGEQPMVANGASDLLVEIFGPERGPHARSAIGMGALPFGIPVEIEGIFEIGLAPATARFGPDTRLYDMQRLESRGGGTGSPSFSQSMFTDLCERDAAALQARARARASSCSPRATSGSSTSTRS